MVIFKVQLEIDRPIASTPSILSQGHVRNLYCVIFGNCEPFSISFISIKKSAIISLLKWKPRSPLENDEKSHMHRPIEHHNMKKIET